MRRALCMAVLAPALLASCERAPSDSERGDRDRSTASSEGTHAELPTEIPDDQSRTGYTSRELYHLEVSPEPNPIPFQQLFTLRVRIQRGEDRETPANKARLDDVRAVMPAHDHGMKTDPHVTRSAPGTFLVKGMRFHMQGAGEDGHWVLELVVNGPEGVDRAEFDFQCCKPQ